MSGRSSSALRFALFATGVTALGGFLSGYCYIVAQTFPVLNDSAAIGPARTFWLYAVVSLFAFVFVLALLPETAGRTLEEIEAGWREENSRRRAP